jgi:NADPH-dependent glutamate synthase beta subunit-like oxidoreductase/glutamate synthase domain-containing protein 3/NAD-dependent dihydropyrimidine dehydrogenase PreA subunit
VKKKVTIKGNIKGKRTPSRIFEQEIQEAVEKGARNLHILANGQHGIGGRIWPRGETVKINIEGSVGQRCGSMGMFGTEIVINGSASDDIGWINCGANITVLGDVTNGGHNAAAQGKLYVQGSGGARCETMTKHNPKFDPPESWYFRDVGDTFAEFKAGGVAVVCGVNPRNPENILGYRPCVGMVGGTIYFRGPIQGFSEKDVMLHALTEQDWKWLTKNMKPYLKSIKRAEYYDELTRSVDEWKKLIPYTAQDRAKRKDFKMSVTDFRSQMWEKDVGKGGIFGEYLTHPLTILPYITTGVDRRFKPVWNNLKYSSPCEYACPTGIPTQKRAQLIREGKLHEAMELILQYSPLPASVCGEICPNLCMQACTRMHVDTAYNIKEMGRASLELKAPKPAKKTDRKVSVIGGGPGGLSAAWHLALKGHDIDLYEAEEKLGGKLELCIPRERLPQRVLQKELDRFEEMGVNVNLKTRVTKKKFDEIYKASDAMVVACGAHKPRMMKLPGSKDMVSAYDFLKGINIGDKPELKGQKIVVIGAGNVGMDVAAEAYHCGAKKVTAVDIQQPAAFGTELKVAQDLGTEILWPKFTEKYVKKEKTIFFTDGTSLEADLVVISIGDTPMTEFLPPNVNTDKNGWIEADEVGFTSDPKVFAIGDATRLGLVTHAIGHAKKTAEAIHASLSGRSYYMPARKPMVPYENVKTAYYDTCRGEPFSPETEAQRCMSCAACRDCHMCEATCYYGAISRKEFEDGSYEYVVDEDLCIGCSFCAGICPCGVWEMEENI